MRYILILFLGLAGLRLGAQAPSQPVRPVRSSTEQVADAVITTPALSQAQVWKSRADQQPADAVSWFNYYLWTTRDNQTPDNQKQQLLAGIIDRAGGYIKNSALYHLMLYLQSGKKDSASLYRVMAAGSDKRITYPYIIQFLAARDDTEALRKYCLESASIAPLPPDLRQYHYNVLMSATQQATIYAKGINDLVPLVILQQVYGVRKDLLLQTYAERVEGDTSAYLCLSLGKEILSAYPEASYTGLLVRVAGSPSTNELAQHFEHDFDRTYLNTALPLEADAALLYRNYLPSLVLLYKEYAKSGNPKAQEIKTMITRIAERTGMQQAVQQLTGE